MKEEDELFIAFQCDEAAIRLLLYSVDTALAHWPGGKPEQQAGLLDLRHQLQSAMLEFTFTK